MFWIVTVYVNEQSLVGLAAIKLRAVLNPPGHIFFALLATTPETR